jgi:hypothetical protein
MHTTTKIPTTEHIRRKERCNSDPTESSQARGSKKKGL